MGGSANLTEYRGRAETAPTGAILLTGLSASGKTTLARSLARRLDEWGIADVVLLDGEELRERLPRRYGYSISEREAVWRELVSEARKELDSGKVVVIAAIAHSAAMRAMARELLQPFFEVHLDCPVDVCAARDFKGQYRRAFASEYDCFIGVTHPYEQTDPELRLDTAALSQAEAETLLGERVIHFLATADRPTGPSATALWLGEVLLRVIGGKAPPSLLELPLIRNSALKQAQAKKPFVHMERRACAQLMVMFAGVHVPRADDGELTGKQLDFLKASGLFRRNLLLIQDPHLDNFSRGISSELPDEDAVARWISDHARSLAHVSEVHSVGYSSGSYGALMFGHLCRMQSVWAFSPRTARPHGSDEAMGRLKEMLCKHNGVTRYNVLYSAANKRDKEFADWLVGCPGVRMHPYHEYGDTHGLLWYLAYHGNLRDILPLYVPSSTQTAAGTAPDYVDESSSS